jgi:hypothetical protein
MRPGVLPALLAASAALAGAGPRDARASPPANYAVGSVPVAPGGLALEFPLWKDLRGEVDAVVMGQGTYENSNPFAYLSTVSPAVFLHLDSVPNLRLSLGFQELLYREVPAMHLPDAHEERLVARARLQQPRGEAALYELLQLDVRSLEDATGTHRIVFRPRLRVGQGFNLDAVRIHSLALFQEVALRFSDADYVKRAFDFFRVFLGYNWTTRRGTFVTFGLLGQIQLNPAATRYDVLWGPLLAFTWRIRSAAAATPPAPDVDVQ